MVFKKTFFFSLGLCLPLVSYAQKTQEKVDLLSTGIGFFNILRDHPRWQYQFEYKWDVQCYNIRPLASFMGTDRGTVYFCGGAGYDIFLGKKLVLTPSFAPGFYFKGKGKDLHFPLEFRSSLELAYIFNNKGRLGAQFYHISNASLAHKNPGAESLIFYYSFPLKRGSAN
jgi:lipid A 3-O-deacylase